MKYLKFNLLFCLLFAIAGARAADTVYVILLGGQSNALGWGYHQYLLDIGSPLADPQTDVEFFSGVGGMYLPNNTLTNLQSGSANSRIADKTPSNPQQYPSITNVPINRFGPELSIGRTVRDLIHTPNSKVAIIKHAIGGSSLSSDWLPDGTASSASDGSVYQGFQTTVQNGLTALQNQYPSYEVEIIGMGWVQGEADSGDAAAYQTNLTTFIQDVHATYGTNLIFALSKLSPNQSGTDYTAMRAAQQAVADADPRVIATETTGTNYLTAIGFAESWVHYLSASYLQIGEDLGNAIFAASDLPDNALLQTTVSSLSVPESGTNTFGVRFSLNPGTTKTVTVAYASGDTDLSVTGGGSLTFTTNNWMTHQLVTLSAAADGDRANSSAIIRCSSPDKPDVDVTATEADSEAYLNYALPWSESFESSVDNAGALGSVDGQHGWAVTGTGTATVQNTTVQSGSQALSVSGAAVSHAFDGSPTNVWITLWAKPSTGIVAPVDITPEASAVFYVNSNNLLVAYNSTTATVLSAVSVSNGWNKFEVSCDYSSKVWNLQLNDTLVVSNFAFYGARTSFQSLEILETAAALYLDELSITDSAGEPDSDSDGLPNWWENTYFGGVTNANPAATASNGVNTVLETYIAGIDPTDPDALFELSDLQGNVLQWSGVSGRVYTVYWTSNLLSGFQTLETNVPWTGTIFTDSTHSAAQEGFYKIEVEQE